jgi:hypothetical protein
MTDAEEKDVLSEQIAGDIFIACKIRKSVEPMQRYFANALLSARRDVRAEDLKIIRNFVCSTTSQPCCNCSFDIAEAIEKLI